MRRYVAFALSSLAAWRAAAGLPGSDAFRRDGWTMHDPGFPVRIDVAPSQDELWTAEEQSDVLHVSSTVLDVSVAFPEGFSADEAVVTMSLFEPTSGADFELVVDSQLQYVQQYRLELDPAKVGDRLVLRVYVEASAARLNGTEVEQGGAKLRAFYARWVDLSPSEPMFLSCEENGVDAERGERVSTHPPANMPPDLCSRYTMDGRVPVRKWYFDDQTGAERTYGEEYSSVAIEALVEDARKRVVGHSDADTFLYSALEKYSLKDKRVLIVGSSGRPWIESLCLAYEAASCTTVARNRLRYNHPKLQTFTKAEFNDASAAGEGFQHFDVVVAVKTVASEGLGRSGDLLDPDGDLKTMQELLKLVTPPCVPDSATEAGPKAFVAVPVGPDTLVWNAQRHYGPLRLPLLLQNWQLLDSFGFAQSHFTAPFTVSHVPLFVLQPPASCAQENADSTANGQHTEL